LRWPLAQIARAIGARPSDLERLVLDADQRQILPNSCTSSRGSSNAILKGSDTHMTDDFLFIPYHARTRGEPVTLIPAQAGPIWFSKRMVRDEYLRQTRGKSTRFGSPSRGHDESPSQGDGELCNPRQGDGSSPSPSPSPSPSINTPLIPDAVARARGPQGRVFF